MKKILGILAITIMAVCFAGCSKNSPEAVMKGYLKALTNNDYAKAMSYTTLSSEDQAKMVSMFEAFASDEMKAEMRNMSYKIDETVLSEDGESATVKYTLIKGEETQEQEEELVKVDGQWKIKETMKK